MSPFTGQFTDNVLEAGGLTEGQDYYIMVHPANPSYDGNFQVCISEQVSYDFIEGAIDLSAFVDSNGFWSSLDSGIVYSNVGATPDGDSTSCGGAPGANVWFKYESDSLYSIVSLDILTSENEEYIKDIELTVWIDTSANHQLIEYTCKSAADSLLNVELDSLILIPNVTTYFSIASAGNSILNQGNFQVVFRTNVRQSTADFYKLRYIDMLVTREIPKYYSYEDHSMIIESTDTTEILSRLGASPGANPNDCVFYEDCNGISFPPDPGFSCDVKPPRDPFGNFINAIGKYGNDDRQKYYIYYPENKSESSPVILLIPGGGWFAGPSDEAYISGWPFSYAPDVCNLWIQEGLEEACNQEEQESLVKDLLSAGYVVVSMIYRLSEYGNNPTEIVNSPITYQDQADDIRDAVNHIRDNFSECIDVAADNIQIVAESAGAHLALVYSETMADPDYVSSVISMYAPTNLNSYGYYLNNPPSTYSCNTVYYVINCPFTPFGSHQIEKPYYPWYFDLITAAPGIYYESNPLDCPARRRICTAFGEEYVDVEGVQILEAYNFIQSALQEVITDPETSTSIQAYSPHYLTENSTHVIPKFIMHGDDDLLVPYNQSTDGMALALDNNGGLIDAPGEGLEFTGTFVEIPSTYNIGSNYPQHLIKLYDSANDGGANHGFLDCTGNEKAQIRMDILKWLDGH